MGSPCLRPVLFLADPSKIFYNALTLTVEDHNARSLFLL